MMSQETADNPKVTEFHNEKRRLFERFVSRFPLKFKDTRCDFGTEVFLRNLSAEGSKITTRQHLYLNDSLNLEVELLDGKGPMEIRGHVVWTKERDVDLWDAGVKFHKVVFMNLWRIYESVENSSAV